MQIGKLGAGLRANSSLKTLRIVRSKLDDAQLASLLEAVSDNPPVARNLTVRRSGTSIPEVTVDRSLFLYRLNYTQILYSYF